MHIPAHYEHPFWFNMTGNHRGIFNRGDDLQSTTTVGTVVYIDIEYAFEQLGPAHVRRSRLMGCLAQII